MGPRPFRYERATSVADVIDCLRRGGANARVLAGGQSLVPLMNLRLVEPELLVDINDLPLAHLRRENDAMVLGALVRHQTLEESEEVRALCPLLSEAAGLVGNVRVRALGTLGGSLAHADPAAELPMVSLALDAQLVTEGPTGSRTLRSEEFFRGYLTTALEPAELLTEVRVAVRQPREGWAVEEFALRQGDFAVVAAAARVQLNDEGRVDVVRLALAGVGPTPVRAQGAEDQLVGAPANPRRVEAASRRAAADIQPESDVHASAAYRRHLTYVLARRALTRALARAEEATP
ncbi:MAG: xanthine dehydrogenase family protein subunit M [Armatimonadota bacterium]|nr:xanthine dehydrogenase family protein subunit M [Armatimonadota bacterium]MDR5696398.1 xanthine dehydrogenase family protein subunit M [Armatimonadota bacterium]